MPVGWMIAIVALWLAVIVLAVIVLGVLRQVTPVLERIAANLPAGPDSFMLGPDVGKMLPHFSTQSIDGKIFDDEQLRGHAALLLFVSAECGPCREISAELGRTELGGLADQLIVITSPGAAEELGIPASVRVRTESANEVSEALSVHGKPFAVAVGPDGIVRALRVPNRVEDLEKLAAVLATESSVQK